MSLPENRRLFNNFAFLSIGFFITRVLTMVATLYATRALGPDAFGSLSFGLNIALLLSIVANMGLDNYLVLAIARSPQESNALIGDAILVKTGVIPLALLAVIGLSIYNPQAALLFFIWMVYSLLHSYLLIFWSTYRGLERMQFQTLLMTGEAFMLSVGEIATVWLIRSVTAVSIVYLVSSLLAVIGGFALLYKMGARPEYRWRPQAWKQLLQAALPFSLIFIYLVIFDKIPGIMITLFSGPKAAGWFNSVYNITTVLSTIPSIIIATVFPFLARKSQQDQQSVGDISTNLAKYVTIIALGIGIVFFVLAPQLIPLLFGNAYGPSVWILQVLAAGTPFLFLSATMVGMLGAVGEQSLCARYTGYTLLLVTPISIFAVWQWGYQGGTIVYITNEILLLGIMLWLTDKKVGKIRMQQAFLAPLAAALGASVLAYLLRQQPFYVSLPAAALLYLGILVLDGAIGALEVDTARRLWQSRTSPATLAEETIAPEISGNKLP